MKNNDPRKVIKCLGGIVLFHVLLDDQTAGVVDLRRKGLYYEITCRCNFCDRERYRVYAVCDTHRTDLGICVPFEGAFGFRTLVAIRALGEGKLRFEAVRQCSPELSVEISVDKPFTYLSRLRQAKFETKNGKSYLTFPK